MRRDLHACGGPFTCQMERIADCSIIGNREDVVLIFIGHRARRQKKVGTTLSPWRYDAAIRHALKLASLRSHITPFGSWCCRIVRLTPQWFAIPSSLPEARLRASEKTANGNQFNLC